VLPTIRVQVFSDACKVEHCKLSVSRWFARIAAELLGHIYCQVPNMYPSDEKAQIMEAARDKGSKEGKMLETMADVWKFFVDKCKANLHIIFAMSPVGQAFKDRLRQFPSLVNCCTIDWFQV